MVTIFKGRLFLRVGNQLILRMYPNRINTSTPNISCGIEIYGSKITTTNMGRLVNFTMIQSKDRSHTMCSS